MGQFLPALRSAFRLRCGHFGLRCGALRFVHKSAKSLILLRCGCGAAVALRCAAVIVSLCNHCAAVALRLRRGTLPLWGVNPGPRAPGLHPQGIWGALVLTDL